MHLIRLPQWELDLNDWCYCGCSKYSQYTCKHKHSFKKFHYWTETRCRVQQKPFAVIMEMNNISNYCIARNGVFPVIK